MRREPDLIIGNPDDPYMKRWYIIPRNKYFNIYLHQFLKDDDKRAMHDHPWPSLSFMLKGCLLEVMPDRVRYIKRFLPVFRRATHVHRLEVHSKEAWTVFITGPYVREWGFHCPKGWRHWTEFVNMDKPGEVGPGCD